MGKAKCLSLQGKQDAAIEMVLQIIKDSSPEDKELLSRAYNVLGGAYRSMAGREQDALIQFLTVDLVYNTLPESHAEALFNLGELWDKGSNPERAREARQNLKAAYPARSSRAPPAAARCREAAGAEARRHRGGRSCQNSRRKLRPAGGCFFCLVFLA